MEKSCCAVCRELPNNDVVICPGCKNKGNILCKPCYKNIILANITQPCCPFCRCVYTDSFIAHSCHKKFLVDIINQRNELLLQQQYMLINDEKIDKSLVKEMYDKRKRRDKLLIKLNKIKQQYNSLNWNVQMYEAKEKRMFFH